MRSFFFLLLIFTLISFSYSLPCNARMMESGIVCVCNSTYCDTLEFTEPTNIGDVLIISSSEKGLRFSQLTTKFVKAKKPVSSNQRDQITIDRSQRFQKIIGFGNSITGAVSINLDLLSKELRNYVYKSYFNNETGLALNMLRTPIGGSDFDIEPWAYNETPEKDLNLTGFSKLDTRDEVKVKHLKELRSVSGNYNIKLLAAAWSPPRWMKQKYEWSGFNYLKPEYYETWALYHVRFLELMRKEGIEFWSISTGNEPLNGNFAALLVPFLSLGWDPISQGNWVANYFGPMLRKSFHEILIISNDDQSFTIPQWFKLMYGAYPESKNYISGHAFHLYWNTITGRRGVGDTYNLYPDKFIMMTEGVNGVLPWDGGNRPVLGSWQRGENYVADIILSLNVYVSAWIDWNMILDENGGPNYTYLKTDSSIITSKDKTEIFKQPSFYALGHFSRFLPPDSIRTKLQMKRTSRQILATAFIRPDKLVTLIICNRDSKKQNVRIDDSDLGVLSLELPPKSVHTILIKVED